MSAQYLGQMGAMVALTFAVCGKAFIDRVKEIRRRSLPLRTLARPIDAAQTLLQTQSMDNFNNLLQMPVLFYVLCLQLMQMEMNSSLYGALLWGYVLLRVAHTVVQVTHNQVLFRARWWMASNLVLCLAWFMLIYQVFVITLERRQ